MFAQEKIDKSANSNQEFDIVILNGRVMDPETLFDDVANVGIKDGRIATITKQQIKGKEPSMPKGMLYRQALLTRIITLQIYSVQS